MNSPKSSTNLQIQYDYIAAYLDFYVGYPDFKMAKEIYQKNKNFPLAHWNELFEDLNDQLFEYEEKEKCIDIDSILDIEKKNKQQTKKLIKQDTKLQFSVENKSLKITYANISSITVKFYLIDIEILFSRTPFIKQGSDDFSFVQPNYVKDFFVENFTREQEIVLPIPEEFCNKNLFIEVSSQSKKCFETYFANNLKVTISENLGEVKAVDNNFKPLNKVYIKCFAKMTDGTVKFYKDGYTDLRGRFNFIGLNTDQLKSLKRFSILVLHPELGSIIKECNPPSNITKEADVKVVDYDGLQQHRQHMKQLWRATNIQKKI